MAATISVNTPAAAKRRRRTATSAKRVRGVENERAVRYGSISSRPVLVAGIIRIVVVTSRAHQRARGDWKHTAASIQQAASVKKSVATYQRKTVQAIERWVKRAVQARMGANRESFSCDWKNSVA